jgi:hypothetical protein
MPTITRSRRSKRSNCPAAEGGYMHRRAWECPPLLHPVMRIIATRTRQAQEAHAAGLKARFLLSMASISCIDEGVNCATRFVSSCVLLSGHVIWHDWGTLRFVPLPSGESASCRSTQFPKISRSLERVWRLIGLYSQEPQRDMPSNGAVGLSTRHKRS